MERVAIDILVTHDPRRGEESRDRKGIYDIYIYISILGDSFESLNFFLSMEKIFCIMEIV